MKKKSVSGILTSNQMILLYIIVVLCVLIGTRNQAFLRRLHGHHALSGHAGDAVLCSMRNAGHHQRRH